MNGQSVVDRQGALTSSAGPAPRELVAWPPTAVERGLALLTSHFAVQLAIVFLAYLIAGKLGQATSSLRSGNIGPVWPAYGIALAGVLAYGPRVWPAVTAGAFLVAFQGPAYVFAALGQAASATLAVVTGSAILYRIPGFNPALVRLRDAIAFIVYGAYGSATISATFGLTSLYLAGATGYEGLGKAWLVYWLGDATGALLVTPLVFAAPAVFRFTSRLKAIKFAAMLALVTTFCIVVFSGLVVDGAYTRNMSLAVLPLVMWAAIDFGTAGAAVAVFVISSFATLATAVGAGPFAGTSPFVGAMRLDVVFSVLALTGLSLAAVIAEREAAQAEHTRLVGAQASMEARLHLAAIVESSNDAVLSMTLNGIILSWNAAAERIFGFTRAEAIGQPVSMLIPSWRAAEEGKVLQQLAVGARIEPYEATGVTKAGTTLNLAVTVASLRDTENVVFGISTIVRDITASKRSEEALSNLSRRLLAAQEEDRRRIARELHDDIGQRLATLAINLDGSVELQQQVAGIASDVQALSHELHSSRIDLLGITAAMRHFCIEFAAQQKMKIDFDIHDLLHQPTPDVSLCLFRILQESLHNAAKHSGVRVFEVQFRGLPGTVQLDVRDSGNGFDLANARTGRGIGLVSMEERLKLVNGELIIDTLVGRGTTIQARVPVPA